MTRRFFFAGVFGTLVTLVAVHTGATAHSPIQAVLVGMLSSAGFLMASLLARGRVRRSQGEAPAMQPGEEARLYGPGTLSDSGGSSEAWFYLSNRRLLFRDASGAGLDLPLAEIEELRPPQPGLLSGKVTLVAKGRGLITLKVPDARRWHGAIRKAIHSR
jgi:hypothetical protein